MGSIIFVHGTSVRQKTYENTFQTLQKAIKAIDETLDGARFDLVRCLWGEVYGARLLEGGASIPGYRGKSHGSPDPDAVKWWLLYQDPLFELKSMSDESDNDLPPNALYEWNELKKKLADPEQPLSPEMRKILDDYGLLESWHRAFAKITSTAEWEKIGPRSGTGIGEFFPEFCRSLAESVIAAMVLIAISEGVPAPTADIRDQILEQFLRDRNALVRGWRDWYEKMGDQAKRIALGIFAAGDYVFNEVIPISGRSWITDKMLPFPADILYYQARGHGIRDFIQGVIEASEPPVFLLAHSLGGIACVDLLMEKDLGQKVKGLITVGSQAPLFYEMDCLVSRPRVTPVEEPGLPGHFPPWLNFHDPNDYLSYLAGPVFKSDKIEDVEVVSREPHVVMAHGAYWNQKMLWEKISAFIKKQTQSTG